MPSQTYNTAGSYTWTCPAGVFSVAVECWGGGGGGASGTLATNGGSGAGGGAYSKKNAYTVTPGTGYPLVVGTYGAVSGLDGGDSTFDTSVCVAKGGQGGQAAGIGGTGGAAGSGVGDVKHSGGNGADGGVAGAWSGGGGGSSAGTAANGNNGQDGDSGSAGGSAPSGGAAGGAGDTGVGGAGSGGSAGSAPAGGGGGGNDVTGAGNGADGQIIFTWSAPVAINTRWIGGAAPVAQVGRFTFAGTWLAAETVTATIGNVSFTTVTGSTAIATILANLVAAYAALDGTAYPAFAEIAATNDSTHFYGTANTAGKPFTLTLSTNSASGTIDGGASSAGTNTTANAGPNSWDTAANWSANAVPAGSDAVTLDQPGAIKYGLDQHTITVASLTITPGFAAAGSSQLGLPQTDADGGYPQYRDTYLRLGITTLNVNTDASLLRINLGTVQNATTVLGTGGGSEANVGALVLKGTHASNTLTLLGGSVDVAPFGGETATFATATVTGGALRTSSGVTLTTLTIFAGAVQIASAVTTLIVYTGSLVVTGSGAITTLKMWGGSLIHDGTGTITNLFIGSGAAVTFTQDVSRTVTNASGYAGGSLTMDVRSTTLTNPIQLVGCSLQTFSLNVGINVSVATAGL